MNSNTLPQNVYQMALDHLDTNSGAIQPFYIQRKGWVSDSFFRVTAVYPLGWWKAPPPYFNNPRVKGFFINIRRADPVHETALSCPGTFGYHYIGTKLPDGAAN